jgi:hypothetical protein
VLGALLEEDGFTGPAWAVGLQFRLYGPGTLWAGQDEEALAYTVTAADLGARIRWS